jgi:cytoskeletal protein CcmA (bactofilin family)
MDKGNTGGTTSLLSKEVKIEGDIQGSENLQVEGKFKGSIKLAGDISIGPTGMVEADVEADNVVIQGQLSGNVTPANNSRFNPRVNCWATARRNPSTSRRERYSRAVLK